MLPAIINCKVFSLVGKIIVFTGFVLANISGYNQSVRYMPAAKYASLGAYSKSFVNVLSATSNQAALSAIKSISAGIYSERRYLLAELNFHSLAICIPVQFGGVGISAEYFGYDEYNETQLSLGYGKSLGKIDVGIQFNYHSMHLGVYGKDALLNIEIGAIMHVTERIRAGLHVFNLTGRKFGSNRLEKIPSVVSGGLGFEASEKVFVSAEFIKEDDRPVNINAGLQYAFEKKLFARLGLYTETTNLYFGVGLRWKSLRVDIIVSHHPQLGFTPGLMLVFEKKSSAE